MKPIDRDILRITLPAIMSNITVPLLGLVDVAIVGHLGSAAYIGAIAVGGMLFNIIYWLFGFLRMGTSGLTSQAYGRKDNIEAKRLLKRAIGIGMIAAGMLIVLQIPIRWGAFQLIESTTEVEQLATTYFHICIWGAPAMLGLYGLTGWFIGMQNSKIPMWIAIVQNVVNIAASLCLVYLGGMKVEGVALGTLIAQYAGFGMACRMYRKHYANKLKEDIKDRELWGRDALMRFFSVNRDIFLRTLCLIAVTMYFTSAGAAQGEVILAVNTLLMQLFTIYSYITDGFAYAGEALSGRFYGARDKDGFRLCTKHLFLWGTGMAVLFTLLYWLGGSHFLSLLTDDATVIAAAGSYFPWSVVIPFCSMAAFVWDGIFIGTTYTRGMLLSMAVATMSFFLIYFTLQTNLHNHALWLAFVSYLFIRGAVQTLLSKRLYRSVSH